MPQRPFLDEFDSQLPVFAMLHLSGDTAAEKLDLAKREIDVLWSEGVDAVIVENYFGDVDDVENVLRYLTESAPEVRFGINILRQDWTAFELARQFHALFIQLDSVAGHLPPDDDGTFAARLAAEREQTTSHVLGGVRFKYQPYLSGRSLEEDLSLARARCGAVVVTGDGTGMETPPEKIEQFRRLLGDDFPLVVGAGVTPANCVDQLAHADAVIVGSYLKDTYTDTGTVDRGHVREFVRAIREVPSRRALTRAANGA
ncbi:BtpA/SgcQ family protein [Micromonospora echinofusca]|uniref:Membrane biogenesis protein n=1 Tax=Micromonospora echinofusca TaxID=47858 RepID=A0ABS3VIQ9_MICEH|nr:BtpA/SgcQ family protein [Micromonospora echinofusca]MBO4204410.1 membrane biogenesis protein [Micromonospora echinofusca]